MTTYSTHWQHYCVTEISRKSPKSLYSFSELLFTVLKVKTKFKGRKFKMSVAKHQACFTTKLQGQNLATFSHCAVTPIAYLQHTVNTNKTYVNNALIMR